MANFKINMPSVEIMIAKIGMDRKGDVQEEVTKRAKDRMEPFVPKRNNVLIEQARAEYDKIIYGPPGSGPGSESNAYARYVYWGKVMAGNPRKATNRPLEYNEAPQRGAQWDVRMMANQGKNLIKDIQEYINNKKVM